MQSTSLGTRRIGIVLAILVVPVVARLVWEMTYLTWRDGEQMIGFTIMHEFPSLFLAGYAVYFGAAVWLLVVGGVFILGKRKPRNADILLLGALVVLCGLPLIPYRAWQRFSQTIWGPSSITHRGAPPAQPPQR
jgi:hypothetical protein